MTSAPPQPPIDWTQQTYIASNSDGSVAIRCGRDGVITGLKLKPEALSRGEKWLAQELPRLADLAFKKSMHGIRLEMEDRARIAGRPPTPDLYREMQLPTAEQIQELENAERRRLPEAS